MLQDMIRTGLFCLGFWDFISPPEAELPCRGKAEQCLCSAGTYYAAIMGNFSDFQDKTVMDVGAGSGILSLFAAQVSWQSLLLAAGCLSFAGWQPWVSDWLASWDCCAAGWRA
jgi:hypothetical protein